MKIVFATTHFGFLRNFESTLRLLARRHAIHLAADRRDNTDGQRMIETLVREHPSITFELVPFSKRRLWYAFGTAVRSCLDYWRYLHPRYRNAPKLRARAERQVPPIAVVLSSLPLLRTPAGLRVLQAVFRAMERAVPSRPEVVDLLRRESPDLLLVTPLLYFGSQQVDHVRCARRLGIKSMLCVGSWDHLTTKGLIHEIPDRVVVWNEPQKREATELHGVPPDRVIVTGAQAYDHWFAAQPSRTKAEFCRQVGLAADRPVILYLCSSPFIAPHEVAFVKKWIDRIRSSAWPQLRSAGLLVRPHPQNGDQWRDVDLSEFDNVALWPRAGANPVDVAARADYYDSMYHSEAVVGVNTSALIESGIVGRPVYSVLDEEFVDTQDGTLHFQHLKSVNGGLLHLARALDEHLEQLAASMSRLSAERDTGRGFIQTFVRPYGLDRPVTPLLVEEIERFGAIGSPAARPAAIGILLLRALLYPAALATMLAALDRDRARSLALHATRPARLAVRTLVNYTLRLVRYTVHRGMAGLVLGGRIGRAATRRLIGSPLRWVLQRARLAAHIIIAAVHHAD